MKNTNKIETLSIMQVNLRDIPVSNNVREGLKLLNFRKNYFLFI